MLQNGIEQSTTTTGTGTFDLTAPTDPLRVSFLTGIGSGNRTFYRAEVSGGSAWEEGWGVVTAGSPDTLTRNVIRSSNGNALVNFAAGTKRIYCGPDAAALRFGAVGTVPTATGTANAIAIAHAPALRTIQAGMAGRFISGGAANTGNVTLAIDGLSALPLRRADGSEIGRGIIRASSMVRWYAQTASELRLDEPTWGQIELDRYVAASEASVVWQLPSGYEQFTLRVENLAPATDGAAPLLQVSENGGSTWFTGATDYRNAYAANNVTAFTGDTPTQTGFWLFQGLDSASLFHNRLTLDFWPGSASRRASFSSFGFSINNSTSGGQSQVAGGFRDANGRVNAIRLLMSSGNISTATCSLMGVRA